MDGIFGILSLVCGLYALYGYYKLKFRNEISESMLLPKGVNVKNCKDYKGYCKEAANPLLLLGVVVTVCGAVDLFNTYIGGLDGLFLVIMAAVFVTLFVYSYQIKKINKKYFK